MSLTHVYQKGKYKTLNITRPLMFEYLKKMKLDTEDNIELFYDTYLRILWNYFVELYDSCGKTDEIETAIKEIRTYKFVNRAKEYLNNSSIDPLRRIGLSVFYLDNNLIFHVFMKIYAYCVHVKRAIRK